MRAPNVIFVVALYLALDMANPLMPGALMFGVDDCVEVRQAERFRAHQQAMIIPVVAAREADRPIDHAVIAGRASVADRARTPQILARRARSALAASISAPSSREDH